MQPVLCDLGENLFLVIVELIRFSISTVIKINTQEIPFYSNGILNFSNLFISSNLINLNGILLCIFTTWGKAEWKRRLYPLRNLDNDEHLFIKRKTTLEQSECQFQDWLTRNKAMYLNTFGNDLPGVFPLNTCLDKDCNFTMNRVKNFQVIRIWKNIRVLEVIRLNNSPSHWEILYVEAGDMQTLAPIWKLAPARIIHGCCPNLSKSQRARALTLILYCIALDWEKTQVDQKKANMPDYNSDRFVGVTKKSSQELRKSLSTHIAYYRRNFNLLRSTTVPRREQQAVKRIWTVKRVADTQRKIFQYINSR